MMKQILEEFGIDHFPNGVELINLDKLGLRETLKHLVNVCEGKDKKFKKKEIERVVKKMGEELKELLLHGM